MNTIKQWAFRALFTGTVVLASCGFKKTESGVEYKVIEDKDSAKVEAGGMVELNLNYYNEADTFISSKVNRGMPIQLMIPDSITTPHVFQEVLLLLTKGDSVHIKMSSDSLYKNVMGQPAPKGLDEGSKTLFEIRIVNVISKDSVSKLRAEYMAKQQQEQLKRQLQFQMDTTAIVEYLKKKKIKASKTADGVYYNITKKQDGLTLQPGDTANTYYAGRLLDGTQFDANFDAAKKEYKDPFPVVVGVTGVIRGWHSALMAMKKGEKATVYIPSMLGYADQGAGDRIPPNSILVFDIEVKP
ncbi:MAG: FKBP-type peptidyl-prolyl cis-trans isomerase [Cytophagaceae bacterium]|jgi:FKBP-type peptidyl-prolyl cis-trans isomerase|nr:FKBP-type peptidyl-prolyl cis-trans isomerase [Cytophagaceae bacterium]